MKHIKTLTNKTLQNTVKKGGCGDPRLQAGKEIFQAFENAGASDLASGKGHCDEYGKVLLE